MQRLAEKKLYENEKNMTKNAIVLPRTRSGPIRKLPLHESILMMSSSKVPSLINEAIQQIPAKK